MVEKKQWHKTLHDQFGQYFTVDNVLYHGKIDHQGLITFEDAALGRVTALDGVIQATERDESIYHKVMIYVPLLTHGHAKYVLAIGDGDGVMPYEVTRHKSAESIMMAEIDAGVVSFYRQYLPNHNASSYDDPRFKLAIDDGVDFVNQTNRTFDAIISDCTNPIGPGESLFTPAFYEGCKRCLNPDGIFVAQDGVYFLQQEEAIDSHREFSHYFSDTSFYQVVVLTYYDGIMTFIWATDNDTLHHLSTEVIQTCFLASGLECRYHNPAVYTATFALPQYLQDTLTSQPS